MPGDAPATFYVIQGSNDIYWRVEAPAKAIGAKACVLREETAAEQFSEENQDGFRWRLGDTEDVPAVYPEHEGAAVWTRPDPLRAAHIDAMQAAGITTVAEVDDNYLSKPSLNIFMRVNKWGEEHHDRHLAAMASADRIVFSTAWLRDRYWKAFRKKWRKAELPEPFVCRNNVPDSDWPTPIKGDGPVRVTWMGSPQHIWDMDIAWASMLYASRAGCEVWTIGYNPAEPEIPPTVPKAIAKVAQWKKVGAKHIPWQKPQDYHRSAIPADIGLCPLMRNDHTLGKSDVKFIEYTINGAAVVASNNEVYNRSIIHGETGLLAGSAEEMLQAVKRLIDDPKLRETLVANAQQYVREERGTKQLREEWGAAVA